MDELIKKQIKKNCRDYVNRKLSERRVKLKSQEDSSAKDEKMKKGKKAKK